MSGPATWPEIWVPPGSARSAERWEQTRTRIGEERALAWRRAVSAALDDDQLAGAVRQVTTPVAGLERRCVPLAQAQLVAWAARVRRSDPRTPLAEALVAALEAGSHAAVDDGAELLPQPPTSRSGAADLAERLTALFEATRDDGLEL